MKSLGYDLGNDAYVEYKVNIKKCDVFYAGGRGQPLTASVKLNVVIKLLTNSFTAEKEFSEEFRKVFGDHILPSHANTILNECLENIVKKIGKDMTMVSAISNLYE